MVGVDDPEWGQRVCASLVLEPNSNLTLDALRTWGKQRLAVYKVPTRIAVVDALPRNALGKVTKPAIVRAFEALT